MELDFDGPLADRMYPILACLVGPRPIVLVTTISPNGKVNAAPFSFFNVLGAERSSVRQAFCSADFLWPESHRWLRFFLLRLSSSICDTAVTRL